MDYLFPNSASRHQSDSESLSTTASPPPAPLPVPDEADNDPVFLELELPKQLVVQLENALADRAQNPHNPYLPLSMNEWIQEAIDEHLASEER